jgi:hypothetical protein
MAGQPGTFGMTVTTTHVLMASSEYSELTAKQPDDLSDLQGHDATCVAVPRLIHHAVRALAKVTTTILLDLLVPILSRGVL